ncbi:MULTISPECIES: GNAT family N-acetyltransferase [unclassified Methanoregula]|uniref:GNAT family N-acetyltransferase n=1 Tax=unclassified Methanoregula TaxID=2649730 RepID=UPI0009D221C5|nr:MULTISPECIES: GNAT family N-acetyltransferase [unclassified Methanoregula]OPX63369.1 MAG: Acetyltransferase (GNAT) family protein [Methanoregula sp. PtaB.Bin085]OPY35027.1 MAG: Acetyltransferase (GNAT) family protein [Methanoregula sp. PtaU1.Bin006]
MTLPAADDEGCVRLATPGDIPLLETHHRIMFEEIRRKSGDAADPAVLGVVGIEYAKKLAREIPAGDCVAWILQIGDRGVSSGAISIVSYVPVPHDPHSRIAFLHSIYTEEEYRHRHFACRITQAAADYCRTLGIRRMYVFTNDAGRPVYTRTGFVPVPNMMILSFGT